MLRNFIFLIVKILKLQGRLTSRKFCLQNSKNQKVRLSFQKSELGL